MAIKIGHNFDYIFQYRWLLKKHMLTTLATYAEKYGTGILLDIGCGDKPYEKLFPLSVKEFIGIDTNKIPTNADVYGSVNKLPIKDNCIDTVLCVWVLDDVPEPNVIFEEVRRILKKKGKFLLVANESDARHFEPFDFFRFTKYAIAFLAERNNLNVIDSNEVGGFWVMIGFKLVGYFRKLISKTIIFKPFRGFIFFMLNSFFFFLDKIHSPKYDIIGNVYVIEKQ